MKIHFNGTFIVEGTDGDEIERVVRHIEDFIGCDLVKTDKVGELQKEDIIRLYKNAHKRISSKRHKTSDPDYRLREATLRDLRDSALTGELHILTYMAAIEDIYREKGDRGLA